MYRRDADGNPIREGAKSEGGAKKGSPATDQVVRETEELVRYLEEKYELKLIEKLERDFHKV